MMILGKCVVGCNGNHNKITDDHTRKVHEKIIAVIRSTLNVQKA